VVGTTEETWPSMIPKENGRYGALSFRDHESTKAATAGKGLASAAAARG
jgi:hypothetical protein